MSSSLAVLGGVCSCFVAFSFLKEIVRNKSIRPHPFTWAIWSGLGLVGLAASFASGGFDIGLLPITIVSFGAVGIFLLSLTRRSEEEIAVSPVLPIVALAGIVGWVVAGDPLIASVCVVVANLMAGIPTFKKMWWSPDTEPSWWIWGLDGFGLLLGMFAIQNLTVAIAFYPGYIMLSALGLSVVSFTRGRYLAKTRKNDTVVH